MSAYKVVTKVNVTLQVEVQRFSGSHTMDEIKKVASEEAVACVRHMVKESGISDKIGVCGDPEVFSILVKEVKP